MDTSDIKNLKYEDLRYLHVDYKDMDLILTQISRVVGNHSEVFIDVHSGTFGILNLSDITRSGDKILFTYEIIGKCGFGEVYVLVKKNFIKKQWIYFKSWIKEINRKILFTLMIWEFIDNQLGAIPQWKDLKILKRK